MNTTIDISRFIPEEKSVIDRLYRDTSCNFIGGLEDLLKLPVKSDYVGDIYRFDILGVNQEKK
jgi:hypothetical protein